MEYLELALKKMIRGFISIFLRRSNTIQIVLGPLRNRNLPKQLASQNIAMILGQYEPQVIHELLSIPGPINVAYDIGAHVGFMTLALANRVGRDGRVFAFEPIPENQVAIARMIDLNRLHQVVQVVPLALGESNGKRRMLLRECSSMHQMEDVYQGKGSNIYSKMDVESCTLDSFIFEGGNPFPQLIKIDVEGAEDSVFKGALKTLNLYHPTLVVEIHGPNCGQELWNLLQDFNYSWWHLTLRGPKPILTRGNLLSHFSKDSWTHHFLLLKRDDSTDLELPFAG